METFYARLSDKLKFNQGSEGTNFDPELSVLTLSPISVNAYMPRILAKSVY
jgi:hypothetical protein